MKTSPSTLLDTLQSRFEAHAHRHQGLSWAAVLSALTGHASALAALQQMEATGGEPDVIGRDAKGRLLFCDCSPESPAKRRSLCYDREARVTRKEHPPKGSAVELATAMGVQLLSDAQYRLLQTLDAFDLKTSSWIATPPEVRALGGALFGDRRYDTVFVYHNGAQSYYAARGFRALLTL